jgi:glycolate oxidase iron-sulfur subunit
MTFNNAGEIRRELAKCMKCGNCQEFCPLYNELFQESVGARGKIRLIENLLQGELAGSRKFLKYMEMCLLCKNCAAKCPSGVDVEKIVLFARSAVVAQIGQTPFKSLALNLLPHGGLISMGVQLGLRSQKLLMKKHPTKAAGYPFFLPETQKRLLPFLQQPFSKVAAGFRKELPKPRLRVGFFSGCLINYMYPQIGTAVVNVLQKNNIEVVIPPGQVCCGTPATVYGMPQAAQKLAEENTKAFSALGVDAIVTACPTCAVSLKKYAKMLPRIYDFSELLVNYQQTGMGRLDKTATYHDACHLKRSLGVAAEPRALLQSIPGMKFVEAPETDLCCGGAGSFSFSHYDISLNIVKRKLAEIEKTGSEILVVGCPACRLQFENGIDRMQMSHTVLHTAQIIEMSYAAAGTG